MDLMGGKVVRARRGERHAYRPIATPLCESSNPVEIARALLGLYPFTTLYIADLDAIQQRGNHLQVVHAVRTALPHVEIWVDAGISRIEDCRPWLNLGLHCVIGSESQADANSIEDLLRQLDPHQSVLSLDYAKAAALGPARLFEDHSLWPQRIIAMTLARVGSYDGPDFELLRELRQRAAGREIYAAGGIRDIADMHTLQDIGISGALLASALHDEKISAAQLAGLYQPN